ncbi:MAG TPA: hypothetical protein VGM24_07920 [Puia sp.]
MEGFIKNVGPLEIVTLENGFIRCEMAPAAGGRITSVYNHAMRKEFLWSNQDLPLEKPEPGTDYDTHFWGGIDELIPNDIPETIDSVLYPDHGELWTTALSQEGSEKKVMLHGKLPLSGLYYEKTLSLDASSAVIHLDYRIVNVSGSERNFLWKLHAALAIQEGDRLITGARRARIADLEYSRFTQPGEFAWPFIEHTDASVIPARNQTMDFFYLYDIRQGEMRLENDSDGSVFACRYDKEVFPYQWYFASYGKFFGHYMAILEPCSSMPMSVNDAKRNGNCSRLEPRQEINTRVSIYAGEKNNYANNG